MLNIFINYSRQVYICETFLRTRNEIFLNVFFAIFISIEELKNSICFFIFNYSTIPYHLRVFSNFAHSQFFKECNSLFLRTIDKFRVDRMKT